MRIMLINHYAGSPELGMEYRPYYLAQEWISLGHEVVIIASSQAHVRTHQPLIKKSFVSQKIDGIEYLWVKTPPYHGNGFSRVLNMWSFVRQLRKNSKYLANFYKPDLVIASSTYPLDNYPAHGIAKKAHAKFYFEVHDLWPLSPMELGKMSSLHPFIIWMQRAENYAYKYADKVISMLPATKEHMAAHGLDLKKWLYVPNGINLSEWENAKNLNERTADRIYEIRNKYKYLIAYTGSFGIANALDSFINASNKLIINSVAMILVGGGPEKKNLIALKEALKAENVFFIESVPKAEMPSLLPLFDVLYIGLQRQLLFRFGISPNKIFDYMMASKPIIQAIDAGNNMVREADCGLSIEPENPEALSEAIKKIIALSDEDKAIMGDHGKMFALQNHNYKVLAAKFISHL